jgi:MFS family permease
VLDLLHYLSVENAATRSPNFWRPLRIPLFRNLLIADLVSDIGTFMQSVGAPWLMTSLTASPMYIALIQTGSALPFFLLALPAGSIGDIFDRRKLILRTDSQRMTVLGRDFITTESKWSIETRHRAA